MSRAPGAEKTSALVARRAAHYVHDQRTRARLGRPPELPFPGLHESLAVHLAAVLPARLLTRFSLERYVAWTQRLARLLAAAGALAYRSGLLLRRLWWRALDAGRWVRSNRPVGPG